MRGRCLALLGHLARNAFVVSLVVQLVLLAAADPTVAASGGGDFPNRRW